MIKKIIKIKSVAKYSDCSAVGDVEWRKITLFHGENAKGKTTLTAILRSLRDNNPKLIHQRKTVGNSQNQEIELLTESSGTIKFGVNGWSATVPSLEIFDVHFINENVYSGLEIDSEHQKCLHNFVLGTQSVALTTEINDIKNKIGSSNEKLRTLRNQILPYARNAYTFDEFIKLKEDSSLDTKIDEKKKAFEVVEAEKPIRETLVLENVPTITLGLDAATITQLLEKTIDTIQAQYLETVEDHKKHLGFSDSEGWIKAGLDSIKDNQCPFCKQSLDEAKELIAAYAQFFNQEYKELKTEISSLLSRVRAINIDSIFDQRELVVARNKERHAFWKKYLKVDYKDDGLFDDRRAVTDAIKAFVELIEAKASNLLNLSDAKPSSDLVALLQVVNQKIEEHNRHIAAYNQEVQKLKSSPLVNLAQLKSEMGKLEVQKGRFDKGVVGLCVQYTEEEKAVQELNKAKDAKQKKLNQLISDIFSKYETAINGYLEKFGTDFRIGQVSGGNYRGSSREPYLEYVVQIANCGLGFVDDGVNPCIKHSLGEGDKAALAFAFFLAKLDVDGGLTDKIIVFDDPLSSFDENRKSATLEQLHRLAGSVKQLIVLTHNPLIAREFLQGLQNDGECKTLHIVRNGQSSRIEECSLIEETAGTYYQNHKTLKKFINDGDSSQYGMLKAAQCIRPLLEGYMRNKYPGIFGSKEWLGDFIDKIKSSNDGEPLSFTKPRVTELESLNDYSKRFHHDTNPNLASQTIVETELSSYSKKVLNFIYQ